MKMNVYLSNNRLLMPHVLYKISCDLWSSFSKKSDAQLLFFSSKFMNLRFKFVLALLSS